MDLTRLYWLTTLLAIGLLGGGTRPACAQETVSDTAQTNGWTTDLTAKLSTSQSAFNNWSEGGLNTLALTSTIDGKAVRETNRWEQTYAMRLSLGLVQQDTLDVRKSTDLIRLNASLQYKGRGFFQVLNPTIAGELRTQFAPGFNYDKDPFELGREPPVKISDFFSPARVSQSLGLTYEPDSWFSQRLSVAGKQTVVLVKRLRPLYDVQTDRTMRLEAGAEAVTSIDREIFEDIRLQSDLTLFQALVPVENPDVFWENVVTMQVNSWLSVDLEFVAIYDANIIDAVQLKEVLSLGVSFVVI